MPTNAVCVHNRGIFVYIFCRISISVSVSEQATDILVLKIERIQHE